MTVTKKGEEWERLRPFGIAVLVSMFLLTCTVTVKTDWYARGFLVPTMLSAFLAAQIFSPYLQKRWGPALILLLLAPQAFAALLEQLPHRSQMAPQVESMIGLNREFPLGTVFYLKNKEDVAHVFPPEIDDVLFSGRAIVTSPPIQFVSYIPHPDILDALGIQGGFVPCSTTRYGKSTPQDRYALIEGKRITEQPCPSSAR